MPIMSPEVRRLLDETVVGYLGLCEEDSPYVLPISFAGEEGRVFFHGGPGRKADALGPAARACLAVTSPVELTKGQDACGVNFNYRSALLFGTARLLADEQERERALVRLTEKYYPEGRGESFRPEVLAKTLVYALEVEDLSYRCRP
jgi:nitroimidazol reductase NimA-like FMN-containing flavoprotein (pyridoxamine 5'-phosphate oxidase superfamily)